MARQLLVIAGPDKDRAYPIGDTDMLLVGSSHMHADICLHDPSVSRSHFEVQADGEMIVVTDLDTTGGTFVNGTKITRQEVRPGDIIAAGATQFRLKLGEIARATGEAHPETEPSYGVGTTPAERLATLAGTTLGHFDLKELLAKGHVGVAYKARDKKINHDVALKVLSPEFAKTDAERQRYISALKQVLAFKHPNLVALLGTGKTGPYYWISSEYVEGESVAATINRGMPVDWKHALRVGIHAGRALEFAHQNRIVHGNVTPQNLLVKAADRTIKLNDLVLVPALQGSHLRQSTLQAKMLAELAYLSPEQTHGASHCDARSDLYSLGAVMYALVAGRPPFRGAAPPDVIKKIRKSEAAPLTEFQSSIPEHLNKAVLKLLAKEPAERYQEAKELLPDLERVARNLGMRM